MQNLQPEKKERMPGVILLGTLISCFIAFYNNYPLVYPDTGSYLHSAWENVVFYDRTIFYGLFIYETSWEGYSVFMMVFCQGLLACYLLYLMLGIFFSGIKRDYFFLSAVLAVTLFTGFSYTVSILIPDIFSSITLLALINLLLHHKLRWHQLILVALIYVYSICTQFSSLPVLILMLASVLLLMFVRSLRRKKTFVSYKRFAAISALTASTLVIIPSVHYHYDGYYKISGGNHVFIMNHLLESGILEKYLEENCEQKNYRICQYKDSLGWDFMWSEKSALQRTGGWEANRQEYKTIIKDILKKDTYFWMVVRKGFEYTLKQFFTFQTTVSPSQMHGSAPYGQVKWRLTDTLREYISSLQQNNKISTAFVNAAEFPLILGSMLVLAVVLMNKRLRKEMSPELRWLVALLMLYCICSSATCANLSTVHPRFQNRVVWLLPIAAAIVLWYFSKGRLLSRKQEINWPDMNESEGNSA